AEDRAAVEALRKRAEESPAANVTLRLVDLAEPADEETRRLLPDQPIPQLPWAVVRYPAVSKIKESVWSGRLDAAAVGALVDSPARREVARRILRRESAVWVLLLSGH